MNIEFIEFYFVLYKVTPKKLSAPYKIQSGVLRKYRKASFKAEPFVLVSRSICSPPCVKFALCFSGSAKTHLMRLSRGLGSILRNKQSHRCCYRQNIHRSFQWFFFIINSV